MPDGGGGTDVSPASAHAFSAPSEFNGQTYFIFGSNSGELGASTMGETSTAEATATTSKKGSVSTDQSALHGLDPFPSSGGVAGGSPPAYFARGGGGGGGADFPPSLLLIAGGFAVLILLVLLVRK